MENLFCSGDFFRTTFDRKDPIRTDGSVYIVFTNVANDSSLMSPDSFKEEIVNREFKVSRNSMRKSQNK